MLKSSIKVKNIETLRRGIVDLKMLVDPLMGWEADEHSSRAHRPHAYMEIPSEEINLQSFESRAICGDRSEQSVYQFGSRKEDLWMSISFLNYSPIHDLLNSC